MGAKAPRQRQRKPAAAGLFQSRAGEASKIGYCRLPPVTGFRSSCPLFLNLYMSSNLHPMLNVAVKAARAAGALINRAALDVEAVRVSLKQTNDFVTEVDQAAEAAIIETLLTAYPGHGILAEESGSEHGAKDSEFIWIIDPLDGTTNFIHGFPFYCVSIALSVRGKIEQAVVYDPIRNDIYSASKGRGAYVNDRRIRVGKRTRLQDSLISTGFPYRPGDKLKPYLNMLGEVMSQCAGVRRPGAAALDLAHIAAGLTDGFFETGLQPWDVAAGSLLITEAGGLIGNYTGEADFIEHGECVAGNPRIYGQLVATLGKYSKFAGAGDKASVRQALQAETPAVSPAEEGADGQAAPAAKPTTLKSKRIKAASAAAPAASEASVPAPDAPF
jgi:myo-inositol-1(or 4)-monophosphatase